MKKSYLLFLLLICSFLWNGCEESAMTIPADTDTVVPGDCSNVVPVIYTAGSYNLDEPSGYSHACYWKNEEQIILDSNPNYPSTATSIYVDKGHVYVAGTHNYRPCYWKDGQLVLLQETQPGYTSAITVKNQKIYVSGTAKASASSLTTGATLWEDGKIIFHGGTGTYTNLGHRYQGEGLVFDGDDWYMSGMTSTSPNGIIMRACYWKNGEKKVFENNTVQYCRTVAIKNHTPYVLAGDYSANNIFQKGYFYENGLNKKIISDKCIVIDMKFNKQGDLYVVGLSEPYFATVWVNNTPQPLSQSISAAFSIAFNANDVYIAGYNEDDPSKYPVACYWKNGKKVSLKTPNSEARDIFIVPQEAIH